MALNYSCELTQSAVEDIQDIADYLSFQLMNVSASQNLLRKIKNILENIVLFPYSMPKVNYKYDDKEYRKFFIENYVGIYYVDEQLKTIYVIAFHYAPSNYCNDL